MELVCLLLSKQHYIETQKTQSCLNNRKVHRIGQSDLYYWYTDKTLMSWDFVERQKWTTGIIVLVSYKYASTSLYMFFFLFWFACPRDSLASFKCLSHVLYEYRTLALLGSEKELWPLSLKDNWTTYHAMLGNQVHAKFLPGCFGSWVRLKINGPFVFSAAVHQGFSFFLFSFFM